jgi:hypothetical protein
MRSEYGKKKGTSVFYASRNAGKISGVDADPLTHGGRLAYFASQIPGKETWFLTPEGYVIYKNVPICRTGSQKYLGRELKKNSGYKPEWGIKDDEIVEVFRPFDEVTSPETIASFEGKSVLDEHPAGDKVLVDAFDEYEGYSKGHGQNVRIGPETSDGETTLLADLFVKHPDLNAKIDGGIREVSCGYTFLLDKDEIGRYVMRQIRGNHIAVVPEGRAGHEIGIGDSAPRNLYKGNRMSDILKKIFTGWAKGASPEEVAEVMNGVVDAEMCEDCENGHCEKHGSKDKKGAKDKRGARGKRSAKDSSSPESLKEALSKFVEAFDKFLGEEEEEPEHEGNGVDAEMCEDCENGHCEKHGSKDKKGAKEKKAGDAKDEAEILGEEELSESEFSVGDAADLLKALKALVAKHGDKGAKDAFNKLTRGVKAAKYGVADGRPDPFAALAHIGSPAFDDIQEKIPAFMYFNGRPYEEGVAAYLAAQKGNK